MIQVLTLFFLFLGTAAGDQDWKAVKRDGKFDYDLENIPLEIKTDGKLGSEERVSVFFCSAGEDIVGNVVLDFGSTVEYSLGYCNPSSSNLPTPLLTPLLSTTDRVWRITLTRTSGVRLNLHCNGKDVLNVLISDTTCKDRNWSTRWNTEVKKIWFFSDDTASDYYRPYTAICTGLKTSWTNMKAYDPFPVAAGTVMTLHCTAGYRIQGDNLVTCTKETEFSHTAEPICVSSACTGLKTEWKSSIKATKQFPVVPGTVVKVGCSDSEALNKGSSDITCTSGTDFNYSKEPSCLIKTERIRHFVGWCT